MKLAEKRISLNGIPASSLFKPKLFFPIQPWYLGALRFLTARWSSEPTSNCRKAEGLTSETLFVMLGPSQTLWCDVTPQSVVGRFQRIINLGFFVILFFLLGTPGQQITPSSLQSKCLPVHRDILKRVLVCRLAESWEYIASVWLSASVQWQQQFPVVSRSHISTNWKERRLI